MSSLTSLEDNLFAEAMETAHSSMEDGLAMETPPSSPGGSDPSRKEDKPGLFSLAQVSMKLTELWSSVREGVFGEDYWIPSDVCEVAFFPPELLRAHKMIYPSSAQPVDNDGKDGAHVSLTVLRGSVKNDPSGALHHVVYDFVGETGAKVCLTIFRSRDAAEALDFCRRCEECRVLLRLLDKKKDVRKSIRDVTAAFMTHPLWRMVHVAIACARRDVFTDDGLAYIQTIGYSLDDIINAVSSPEGQLPLMMAIERQQASIVRFLLRMGADPAARDMHGNNALHYAALASVQMLEVVWESPASKTILNETNNDGCSPVLLAIRNANPRCLKTLLGFGAELKLMANGTNPLFEAVQSKGKSVEVIRALLEASPELLTAVDEPTGNNVLHAALYKLPLMGVLILKHREMDLNATNKAGQTALHLYASRGDIGMIVTLASYHADLNVPNKNGNTALHLACSKRYLHVTRLLLTLGADANLLNEHNESPRHMAAKLNEANLLKSLVICGARRCPPTKSGCTSGCVNEKSLQFLSKPASFHGADGQPAAAASAAKSKSPTRAMSTVEELERRENIPKGGYRYNRIQDAEHNAIYEEMLEKLTAMAQRGERNSNTINILTMDGGGIRGLVIIQTLMEVERILGEPVFKYFDWVAGTSTGALLAAGLSIGLNLRQLQMVYLRFKDMIFEGYSRPYNTAVLEGFIQSELGKSTLMSDIKWPRLMFTTTRADIFPVQLEFLRNYRLPLSGEENEELGFGDPTQLLLWKALRRSSAAPTYFSGVDGKYIDGGIISNNPTVDLLTELQLHNSVQNCGRLPNAVQVGCVLSMGTGVIPSSPTDPSHLELTANPYTSPYANALAIKNLGLILVDQVTATEGAPVNRSSSWCITHRIPFFRLSAPLFKDIAMDTKDDVELAMMMWDCLEYTYKHKEYIEKCCALLRRIGEAWTRRNLFQSPDKSHCEVQTQTSRAPSPSPD